MELGVHGSHGPPALSPVVEEQQEDQGTVTLLLQLRVDSIVMEKVMRRKIAIEINVCCLFVEYLLFI